MTTTDYNPNSPDYGQTVRGFEVHFRGTWRGRKIKSKFPCTGFPPLTGEAALEIMETYLKRGYEVQARTATLGVDEFLTIRDMREMYGNGIPCHFGPPESFTIPITRALQPIIVPLAGTERGRLTA